MPEITLTGCTPEPLMSYLKTLGLFRLVAEQIDGTAKLYWKNGEAVLDSSLDRETLLQFFLNHYSPTPILAPWNSGSGFYTGTTAPLQAVETSTSVRMQKYRDTIEVLRNNVPSQPPKDEAKAGLLIRCRAIVDDDVVPWLDACFALEEEGAGYFPLLGTGANDGRLEFTNNFMQRLKEVIAFSNDGSIPENSQDLLSYSLFADGMVSLNKAAVGQFHPGSIGGANSTQGKFEGDSKVNPWDFILMMEGTLVLGGSVARRFGASGTSRSSFPFCVSSVAVGYGSSNDNEETSDGSRDELWLPLWSEPSTWPSLRQLYAEGRAQLGRRQARNSVEFSLAVSLLGVGQGLTSFVRYGFLKRNGLAFLAAPLGRIEVRPRPKAELLNDAKVREWLDRLRSACRDKDKTPIRYQVALRHIDRAMFGFCNRSEQGNDAKHLIEVLAALGRAERTLAGGIAFCKEKYIRPLQGLSPQWLEQANDGSAEFRLAASLAGIQRDGKVGSIRCHLEEVAAKGSYFDWSPGSTSSVWRKQNLSQNLAAIFQRRQIEAFREGQAGVPLDSPIRADLSDIEAFLSGLLDEERLADLLWALVAVNWSEVAESPLSRDRSEGLDMPLEYGALRLLAHPAVLESSAGRWTYRRVRDAATANVRPSGQFYSLLHGVSENTVARAVNTAAKRLKASGCVTHGSRNRGRPSNKHLVESQIDPIRLLGSMLFPLSAASLESLAKAILFPPEIKE